MMTLVPALCPGMTILPLYNRICSPPRAISGPPAAMRDTSSALKPAPVSSREADGLVREEEREGGREEEEEEEERPTVLQWE